MGKEKFEQKTPATPEERTGQWEQVLAKSPDKLKETTKALGMTMAERDIEFQNEGG